MAFRPFAFCHTLVSPSADIPPTVDRIDSDLNGLGASLGWHRQLFFRESEIAVFGRTHQYAQKMFHTTDIVRDAIDHDLTLSDYRRFVLPHECARFLHFLNLTLQ